MQGRGELVDFGGPLDLTLGEKWIGLHLDVNAAKFLRQHDWKTYGNLYRAHPKLTQDRSQHVPKPRLFHAGTLQPIHVAL